MKFASTGLQAACRPTRSKGAQARQDSECGLTLLEVLVALTVLAIALTSLFEAQSTAARAARITEETSQARLIAQATLAEAVALWKGGQRQRSGLTEGYAWRVQIAPETAPWSQLQSEASWRLYRVHVAVEWGGKHRVTLDTLRLGVGQ